MQWIKTCTVSLVVYSVLLATVSFAQPKMAADLYRGSKIIGADVENPQGEDLGDIKDLVFDSQGRITYTVLAFGGFLGMGEKYFAVPFAALKPKVGQKPGDRERYVLNVDKERLKAAPGFDRNNWPNMADRSWAEQIHAFYGVAPYWEHREARMHESTGMTGMAPASMVTATIQHIDQGTNLIRMRTTNNEVIEMQATAGLLSRLQDGDRVEVVIRKHAEDAQPSAGQPMR